MVSFVDLGGLKAYEDEVAKEDKLRTLTFREAVEEKVGSWLGLPGQGPEARLVNAWRKRREDWRGHWHAYLAVNAGLFALNGVMAVGLGVTVPWFLFPAVGWGMGLAVHTLDYRAWVNDRREEIEAAAKKVGVVFEPPGPLLTLPSPLSLPERVGAALPRPELPPPTPEDPRWTDLLTRCRTAADRAEAAFQALPGQGKDARQQLKVGLEGVARLAEGAVRIQAALGELGAAGSDEEIAALDESLVRTTDPRLREVQIANRSLLLARREKIRALGDDHERMYANAQGFSLALENIALDAARLGQTDAEPLALSEPISRLADEVRILGEVEAELRKLP